MTETTKRAKTPWPKTVSICALCREVNLRTLADCPIKLRDVAEHLRKSAWYLDNIASAVENAADVRKRSHLAKR